MATDTAHRHKEFHDHPEDYTCPRCGWKVVPVESFVDTFQTPDGDGLVGILDDSDNIYPVVGTDLDRVWLPAPDERVPVWNDDQIVDVLEYSETKQHRFPLRCTWCFQGYKLPDTNND